MPPPGGSSPEQVARQEIDKLLTEAAWIVQSRDAINLGAEAKPLSHSLQSYTSGNPTFTGRWAALVKG